MSAQAGLRLRGRRRHSIHGEVRGYYNLLLQHYLLSILIRFDESISIADFFPPNRRESISTADFFPPNCKSTFDHDHAPMIMNHDDEADPAPLLGHHPILLPY